jgi:hypothetical protein
LKRDGGCILRHYTDVAGKCGGYRTDGGLILQFDHFHSRANSISYGDLRLGGILCKRHHIFWKKQYPDVFMQLVKNSTSGGKNGTAIGRAEGPPPASVLPIGPAENRSVLENEAADYSARISRL